MASSTSKGEYLEVGDEQVPITHPDKVVFPEIGVTKLDLMRYYLDVAPRCVARGGGSADDPQALRQGHHRRGRFPEAGPREESTGLRRRRGAALRVRHLRQGGRASRRGGSGLGGQPRLCRPQSRTRFVPTTSDTPTNCGSTSTRCRVSTGARSCTSLSCPRGARGARTDRVAEDIGIARLPHLCAHRAALAVQIRPAGRADSCSRGRATRTRPGHRTMVEGGTRGRFRRLQPKRVRSHRRLGVLGARDARRPRIDTAALG